MPPKIILFAGAPTASAVTESTCTISTVNSDLLRFLGPNTPSITKPPSPKQSYAPWRSLSLETRPLRTGLAFSQMHHPASRTQPNDFFTAATLSFDESASLQTGEEDVLTSFCEHSLANHEPSAADTTTSASLDETSFLTATSDHTSSSFPKTPLPPCHLSDVEDIPSPKNILSLVPATITVNLIAGIISIAQPRTVTTRYGRQLSLVELLVGDETKSGFGITFWLGGDSIPASVLANLRRQDVVLIRNVALNVFRDKVYGQSLRKGLTKVNLLWRKNGGGFYSRRDMVSRKQALDPQLDKARRVKDWVIHFVGGDRPATRRTTRARKSWDQPPDDTQ
ncbi:uncharacterized protein F5Z01DRAFT_281785 [Emericellopsis atlantica]|uniref:Uncharacterized protein n=1 Tax=Emericellopsis atlantica TaxID=2614577 RepID=A0A9P8CLC3_9HYPO|nr:uncharacterized protein F5Z01DRAFT_281785 [Emericellopsis atlantica]KAG9251474.1 hypothetical protein F5Z01DRAFT_281785 [Emericellopsis atlantica]